MKIIEASIDTLLKIHSQHITHGDLKLRNILYDATVGSISFIDFGQSQIDNTNAGFDKDATELLGASIQDTMCTLGE